MASEEDGRRVAHAMAGDPRSIGEARRVALSFLGGVGGLSPGTTMDVLLAVSELVTNAVSHAPGPCTLVLESDAESVLIAVRDGNRAVPVPSAPRLIGRGGLGLHMLKALAGDVRTEVGADGKTVSVVITRR